MAVPAAFDAAPYCWEVRRGGSLSRRGRICLVGSLALVCTVISVPFAWLGAWLILPFAGLDVLLLGIALVFLAKRDQDYERVTIEGDRVLVELCDLGQVRRMEFNRHWAQVVWRRDQGRGGELALRSHGREICLGRHLAPLQRKALAEQLKSRFGTAGPGR
jgi:uncharacterized membrane protein